MKILTIMTSLLLYSAVAFTQTPTVTKTKVIELSAHRIDRLVALGKIDASFLKKLEKMEVSTVQNQAPVFYKVRASQTKPAQGNPMQVDISYDADGKPLAFQLVAGGAPGPDMAWPDKDAGSLAENCLHYVLENNSDAKVALFDKGAVSFTLSKGSISGQDVARGQMTSSLTSEKLNIYVKFDGTFISANFTP